MSKPLRHELAGWRVARRGDYRVTFRILDDDHALLIGRVEHRAHIYRPTTGVVAPQLQVIVDALSAMQRPNSGLTWIRQPHVARILTELARHPDITHDVVDYLPPTMKPFSRPWGRWVAVGESSLLATWSVGKCIAWLRSPSIGLRSMPRCATSTRR